jgi:hypothetical protein
MDELELMKSKIDEMLSNKIPTSLRTAIGCGGGSFPKSKSNFLLWLQLPSMNGLAQTIII